MKTPGRCCASSKRMSHSRLYLKAALRRRLLQIAGEVSPGPHSHLPFSLRATSRLNLYEPRFQPGTGLHRDAAAKVKEVEGGSELGPPPHAASLPAPHGAKHGLTAHSSGVAWWNLSRPLPLQQQDASAPRPGPQ